MIIVLPVAAYDQCDKTVLNDADWFQYISHIIVNILSEELLSIELGLNILEKEVTSLKKTCSIMTWETQSTAMSWTYPCGKIYFYSLLSRRKVEFQVSSAFGINITFHEFNIGGDAPDCVEYAAFVVTFLNIYRQQCYVHDVYCGKFSKPWSKIFQYHHLGLHVASHLIWNEYYVEFTFQIVNSVWFELEQTKHVNIERRIPIDHITDILSNFNYRFGRFPMSK